MRKLILGLLISAMLPMSANATACSSQWSWSTGTCPDYNDNDASLQGIVSQIPTDSGSSQEYIRTSAEAVTAAGLTECVVGGDVDYPCLTAAAIENLKLKFNKPTGSTAQYIRGDGTLATLPSAAPTFNNNVSRSLNSNYTISSTLNARVSYSVNVSWTLQALLSGNATAFLEYSTNAGSTWTTVNQVSKSIGLLTFAGADDMNLVGEIPANALSRIRTTATNMTVAYTRGQEVLQ